MAIRPEVLLALDKFKDDAVRDVEDFRIAPKHKTKSFPVDSLVRIRGTVEVGADQEKRVAAKVPWQKLCAVLLDRVRQLGGPVEVGDVLSVVMQGNGKLEAAAEELGEAATAAMAALLGSTTQLVRGPVKVHVTVEEVSLPTSERVLLTEAQYAERYEPAGGWATRGAFEEDYRAYCARLAPPKMDDLDPGERASIRRAQRRTF